MMYWRLVIQPKDDYHSDTLQNYFYLDIGQNGLPSVVKGVAVFNAAKVFVVLPNAILMNVVAPTYGYTWVY